MKKEPEECPVCVGDGTYPIHHKDGRELYGITCPECFGQGTIEHEVVPLGEEVHPEQEYEYPPSMASRIKTIDELRAYIKAQSS